MMQQPVPIKYFVCSMQSAEDALAEQRPCDVWILDWPLVDPDWLFGNAHPEANPTPIHSPLARLYYDTQMEQLTGIVDESFAACEQRRFAHRNTPTPGLRINVTSQLDRRSAIHAQTHLGLTAPLSVNFRRDAPPPRSRTCPPVPRELFEYPIRFDFVAYGPGAHNMRWHWQDAEGGQSETVFERYDRPLQFHGGYRIRELGTMTLTIDRLLDLSVRFEPRPKPAKVAARVKDDQKLNYQITTGNGYFNVAIALEWVHVATGQRVSRSIHGPTYAPGQLPVESEWPEDWGDMTLDSDGVIRHGEVIFTRTLFTLDPDNAELPASGDFQLRCLLISYGYDTQGRFVTSPVLGDTEGDTRMSWQPISVTQMASQTVYIPGTTQGLIPPLTVDYRVKPILSRAIGFEAVFDLKDLTTFRFVVKVSSALDFPIGLIIQVVRWQAWIPLLPGQTRYLGGATSVTGINGQGFYLHPTATRYGWLNPWGDTNFGVTDGICQIGFHLYLTAPDQPDCIPPELPTRQASYRWQGDPTLLEMADIPQFSAIKRFAADGRYDYDFQIPAESIASLHPGIEMPAYAGLLNPNTYFVTGYATSPYDLDPWHIRPWTISNQSRIMCRGERQQLIDGQLQWVAVDDISLDLSRTQVETAAAFLAISESLLMDGDDIRWFYPDANGVWQHVLWINRFYTLDGSAVNEASMRNAFQAVIHQDAETWRFYRKLSIHEGVRFGTFLDNGANEAGRHFINTDGHLQEVAGLDVNLIGTRFLYRITYS